MKPLVLSLTLLVALPATLTAVAAQAPAATPASRATVSTATVLAQYGRLVHANYEDSLASARRMQKAIAAFTAGLSKKSSCCCCWALARS